MKCEDKQNKGKNGAGRSAAQIPDPTPLDSKSLDAARYKLNHFNKVCHGIKRCTTQASATTQKESPAAPKCFVTKMKCDVERFSMHLPLNYG